MLQRNRTTWFVPTGTALALCTIVTAVTVAAPPTLDSIAVTPAAASISVGQEVFFKARGTFSDGSTHALGPAIADIALGSFGSCVLLTSGGLKCWGRNYDGQLGNGTTADTLIPRRVKGIAKAKAVALEQEHGCGVLDQGAVNCWGRNDSGQLGNGTNSSSAIPVAVTGVASATAIGVGWSHSCALTNSGAVKCWGYNYNGQLGDGTDVRWSYTPVAVAHLVTATALASGGAHNCAVLADGAVQCWGANGYGQLGNGSTSDSNVPVRVPGVEGARAVAAGAFFSCALLGSGAVKCWGHGGNAELGDGSNWPYADSSVPVSVVGISTAVAITAGAYHVCALLYDGSASCWGYNNYGQLGNGSTTASASNVPIRVNAGGNAAVRLAAGAWHTCALLPDGAMRCWGLNADGQLGNRRTTGYTPTRWPVNVIGTPGVLWRSSDSSRAAILGSGRATGREAGNATITATTAGFINDNAVLTVK